ncbi:MAG: hypothetical protein PUJ24_01020, partial [Bacteroidales bacterium]|nr:hypothetical protein [Bacteroidales bacterium]
MIIKTIVNKAFRWQTNLLALSALAFLTSCQSGQDNGSGTLLTLQDGKQVRVQVVNDNIIRVSAVNKGGVFDKDQSLMV